jgi:Ca2+-binding RTX toxin-like protein
VALSSNGLNKGGTDVRRAILLVAMMALTLVVASGMALAVTKIGTNGPDTLRGTNQADNLLGKGGNDILLGRHGRDNLLGGPGKDLVFGGFRDATGSGNKNLAGGDGNDALIGAQGSDVIVGAEGNDFLVDGNEPNPKQDAISSGPGNDGVMTWNRPAGEDVVTCGSGFDRVFADRDDTLGPDCERVFIGSGSEDEFFESFPESFFEGLP